MPSFRKLADSFWKFLRDFHRDIKRARTEEFRTMMLERQIWKLEPEQYYVLFKKFGPEVSQLGNEAVKEVRRICKEWVFSYPKEDGCRTVAVEVFLEQWTENLEVASLIETGDLAPEMGHRRLQAGGAYTVAAMYLTKLDRLLSAREVCRLASKDKLPFLDLSIENLSEKEIDVPEGVFESLDALEALPHVPKIFPDAYSLMGCFEDVVSREKEVRAKVLYPTKASLFGVSTELLDQGVPVDELPALREHLSMQEAFAIQRKELIEMAKSQKEDDGPSMLEMVEKMIEMGVFLNYHVTKPETIRMLEQKYEDLLTKAQANQNH